MFGKGKREKAKNLMENGARAVGTVLMVQDTGMTMNDNPRVKMRFRIEPLEGGAAFEGEKTSTVSRVMIPRQGDRYPVWFDREDPSSWAYATVSDDQGRQQLRAMFGAVAETFTGVGNGAPAAAAAPADPAERMAKLEQLRSAGLITEEEYAAKRAQLVAEL